MSRPSVTVSILFHQPTHTHNTRVRVGFEAPSIKYDDEGSVTSESDEIVDTADIDIGTLSAPSADNGEESVDDEEKPTNGVELDIADLEDDEGTDNPPTPNSTTSSKSLKTGTVITTAPLNVAQLSRPAAGGTRIVAATKLSRSTVSVNQRGSRSRDFAVEAANSGIELGQQSQDESATPVKNGSSSRLPQRYI